MIAYVWIIFKMKHEIQKRTNEKRIYKNYYYMESEVACFQFKNFGSSAFQTLTFTKKCF